MDSNIAVAFIVAGGTIVTQLIIAHANKKTAEESKKATLDVITYRLDRLEEKVTKHNNVVERLVLCEASTKAAHDRIDRIEDQ
jgi:hypothetical protein